MKNKVVYGLLILILIALGVEGYFLYESYRDNDEIKGNVSDDINDTEENNDDDSNLPVVTREKIMELAGNSKLRINTEFTDSVLVSANSEVEISLVYDDGLYLVGDNGHKVKVNNFNEKVVVIKDARNTCSLEWEDILILTEEGNLYLLEGTDPTDYIYKFESNFYQNFNEFESYDLKLKKLNGDKKVLAFTNYSTDTRNASCGWGTLAVYAEDEKYYYYKNFQEVDHLIEEEILPKGICRFSNNCGLLVFSDGTISNDGESLIKNSLGNNLIYKESYIDSVNESIIYVVDVNNELAIFTFGEGTYDIVFKKLKTVEENGNKVTFTFDNDEVMEIDIVKD